MTEKRTIGQVGDGQLGRMNTQAAMAMGYDVVVLGTAGPDSPAAQVGARQIDGELTDPVALQRLAEQVDVLTWEIEHINAKALGVLRTVGYNIQPSPYSLELIQNKYLQKLDLNQAGLPVAPYYRLENDDDLFDVRVGFGDQIIVKTRKGGYDGRGNLVVTPDMSWDDIQSKFARGGAVPEVYAEKIIPFQRELAVIGARDMRGQVTLFPVVETEHQNNICHTVTAPANIDPRVRKNAEELGRAVIAHYQGAGVIAVEMFQDPHDNVLVNEIAPRVHNSGHYSIEGAVTSQFAQHIRAITGQRLGNTAMTAPAAVMVNILGTKDAPLIDEMKQAEAVTPDKGVFIHWYGKAPRPKRKIGHITVLGDTAAVARRKALAVRASIEV